MSLNKDLTGSNVSSTQEFPDTVTIPLNSKRNFPRKTINRNMGGGQAGVKAGIANYAVNLLNWINAKMAEGKINGVTPVFLEPSASVTLSRASKTIISAAAAFATVGITLPTDPVVGDEIQISAESIANGVSVIGTVYGASDTYDIAAVDSVVILTYVGGSTGWAAVGSINPPG